ncbi:thioredoxin domain-containing protein 6-like [Athalia rosae]|uniref:thioredoxin domain-containing protein 6-like n=1 Tax=Athalia rosae TaxID=37344 RepID=UPI0020343B85|nr:thioredoxin domain-containing protein 6-like [Athalia rosae]
MAKKAGPVALQTEVAIDAEWTLILARKGLVLVDVYSDWSGPCTAMISSLKKIKMELGGDILSYAVARNDEITDLQRFRGKSEPVWMFLQNGTMVNMMFGAHCPDLSRLLIDEIRRLQRDEPPKWSLPASERGPEEQKRWEISEERRSPFLSVVRALFVSSMFTEPRYREFKARQRKSDR